MECVTSDVAIAIGAALIAIFFTELGHFLDRRRVTNYAVERLKRDLMMKQEGRTDLIREQKLDNQ